MITLLSLSIALAAGLLLSRFVKPLKLPAVTGYLIAGILVMVLTSLNNPLIAIITFALFIASFMLYAYSRQNIALLKELLED